MSQISFVSTPNPSPYSTDAVTWEVSASSNKPVTWTMPPEGSSIVTMNVIGNGRQCSFTPTGVHGSVLITATIQPGSSPSSASSVSCYLVVTTAFAYIYFQGDAPSQDPSCREAPSNNWTVVSGNPGNVVSFAQMANHEMAYMPSTQAIFFNGKRMHDLHSNNDGQSVIYYGQSYPQGGSSAIGSKVYSLYVYGPDGTLWKSTYNQTSSTDPVNMPSHEEMQENDAPLAWAPQDAPPAGASAAAVPGESTSVVMCFILDQSLLTVNENGTTTYYNFSAKSGQ